MKLVFEGLDIGGLVAYLFRLDSINDIKKIIKKYDFLFFDQIDLLTLRDK